MKQTRRTYLEVLLAIAAVWLTGLLVLLAAVLLLGELSPGILTGEEIRVLSGWTIGCAGAAALFANIKSTLETAMEFDEKGARNRVVGGYMIRYIGLVVLVAVCYFLRLGNVIALVCGLFTLKLAAYLQPLAHKVLKKLWGEEQDT